MQRVHDVKKWKHVPAGGVMNFENTAPRRIRLDVNTPGMAVLWYADGDGETTLLAVVTGRDVIEFVTHGGTFSIDVAGADIWVYTIDGEDLSFRHPDAVKFTEVIQRRARDPQAELMAYYMRHNMQVMLDQQRAEFDRMRAELARDQSASAAQSGTAGDAAGVTEQSESDGGAGTGGGDPPKNGGDNGAAKEGQ